MIALPPPPESAPEVRTIDFEIQAPNAEAKALQDLVVGLFGIQLNEKTRILTLKPSFPESWKDKDAAITTADFDFSTRWTDHICTWDFEGFGAYAQCYDSIVVYAPQGTLMAGELADTEGVCIYYIDPSSTSGQVSVTPTTKLSRKERKALEKQEKERKKREKKEAALRNKKK